MIWAVDGSFSAVLESISQTIDIKWYDYHKLKHDINMDQNKLGTNSSVWINEAILFSKHCLNILLWALTFIELISVDQNDGFIETVFESSYDPHYYRFFTAYKTFSPSLLEHAFLTG